MSLESAHNEMFKILPALPVALDMTLDVRLQLK